MSNPPDNGIYALIGAITVQAALDLTMTSNDKAYQQDMGRLVYSARRWLSDMGLLTHADLIANIHKESANGSGIA